MRFIKFGTILFLMLLMTFSIASASVSEIKNYEVIIQPQFDDARNFSEGYAAVKIGEKWGYIDENGEYLVPPQFDYAASFSEGKALCGKIIPGEEPFYNYWNLKIIDYDGNAIDLKRTDEITGENSDVFIDFCIGDFNEETGEYDLENTYNYRFNNGHIAFSAFSDWGSNGRWVYNSKGELFTSMYHRGYGQLFNDGLIVGSYTNAPHVLDKNKNEIMTFYDSRLVYYNGTEYIVNFLFVFEDNHTIALLYNENADSYHLAIMDIYKNIKYLSETNLMPRSVNGDYCGTYGISEGIFGTASKDGLFGAIDLNGNICVPFIYEDLLPCHEGLIACQRNGLWGFVDTKGNIVIEPQYTRVTSFNNGMALATKDNMPFVIDRYNNVYANSEKISLSNYFLSDTESIGIDNYVTIYQDGKYGFAKFDYSVAHPPKDAMSDWAYEEVIAAITNKLIPVYMQNRYTDKITRAEFATIIVNVLSEFTGKNAEEIKSDLIKIPAKDFFDSNPFADITDENIIIANKLGIINGVSADTFNHAGFITREDAAVMIMRLVIYLNPDITIENVQFGDETQISDYAKDAVDYVASNSIMKGVGENLFSPKSNITKEQAYITILRVLNSLK